MQFRIEQECPQCAAPIELDQTDHLLECPYCNVKNFIISPDYFRFILPAKPQSSETIFAPYLHFKGAVYTCAGRKIHHRITDVTQLGVKLPFLPISLGFRPQAMKMKFVTRKQKGIFLNCSLKVSDMLARATKSSALTGSKTTFYAHIGEAVNLIYLPMTLENNTVLDAVTNNPLTKAENLQDTFGPLIDHSPGWQPKFMATLCPQCGWNLDGERDSIILFCHNCNTAWEANESGFSQIKFSVQNSKDENSIYLPFWRLTAITKGRIVITSFADFIRITNQPKVIQPAWEQENMRYFTPAFKIRPQDFLRLAAQLTVSHEEKETVDSIPKKNLHPVNFPRDEAMQSLGLVLAKSTLTKVNVFPYLSEIDFSVHNFSILYLPFSKTSHELVQEDIGITINKNALTFGRNL